MVRTVLAAILVNRAADRLEYDNSPEQALELTQRALRLVEHKKTPLARAHAGRAHQVRAESYLKLDRLDDAIASYSQAESELQGRYVELYVRCCHDAAITFGNMGLEALARSYAAKGKNVAARVPGPYSDDFDRLLLELEECTAENYRAYAHRMRDRGAEARDPEDARKTLYRLALATCEFGTRAEVKAIFEVIEALHRNSRSLEQRVAVLAPLVFLARDLQPVPDVLRAATEQAVSEISPDADTAMQAEVQLTYAVALWSRGRREDAVEAALRSVALFSTEAWRTGASVVRLLTGAHRNTAQDVALRLACESGDGALAAELIESARLPALPDISAPAQTITFTTPTGAGQVTRRPLGPLHPIEVGGESRIARHYPPTVSLASPIDLDTVIATLGGNDTWWWGTWLGAYGVLFWAVRTPNGRYTCGIQDDPAAGAKLVAALEAMPDAGEAAVRGVFTATYLKEEAFSAELGALLVPAELRAAVCRAATKAESEHRSPLPLVVASNYLSTFPFILLGVGQTDARVHLRLVEGATVRLAPPAVLLARLGERESRPLPYPVSVICRDQSDELKFAQLSADCQHLLGGRRFCQDHPGAKLATPENLVAALRSVDSAASILAYCGHAEEGDLGPDLESNIPLVDGSLTAESIFVGDAGGDPIPMPERVLLAACNSAGSGGTGSGEWLGLTAAALSAGARAILATSWTIWDLPATRELDAALLDVLRNQRDVAAGLRGVQLRCLDRWRACDADYTSRPIQQDAPEPFPLVWAAYHCFGA